MPISEESDDDTNDAPKPAVRTGGEEWVFLATLVFWTCKSTNFEYSCSIQTVDPMWETYPRLLNTHVHFLN